MPKKREVSSDHDGASDNGDQVFGPANHLKSAREMVHRAIGSIAATRVELEAAKRSKEADAAWIDDLLETVGLLRRAADSIKDDLSERLPS